MYKQPSPPQVIPFNFQQVLNRILLRVQLSYYPQTPLFLFHKLHMKPWGVFYMRASATHPDPFFWEDAG
jgi:hypothetical protein